MHRAYDVRDGLARVELNLLARRAVLELHDIVLCTAFANDQLIWPADEIGVGEFDSGALVTVVKGDFDTRCLEFVGELGRERLDKVVAHLQGDHADMRANTCRSRRCVARRQPPSSVSRQCRSNP